MSSPHKHPVYVGDALECALLNGIVDQIPDLGSDSRPKSGSWNVRVNEKTAVWVSGVLKREAVIGDDDIGVGVDGGGGKSVAVLEGRDTTLKTVLTHEFDAAVQRMTVIALVTHTQTNKNENKNTRSDRIDSKSKTEFQPLNKHDYLVAMKGSPESVFLCLKREHQKDEKFKNMYFLEYGKLAKMGKRVIAFASKRILDLDSMGSGRENAEKDLVFQGFVAFACPLRYALLSVEIYVCVCVCVCLFLLLSVILFTCPYVCMCIRPSVSLYLSDMSIVIYTHSFASDITLFTFISSFFFHFQFPQS